PPGGGEGRARGGVERLARDGAREGHAEAVDLDVVLDEHLGAGRELDLDALGQALEPGEGADGARVVTGDDGSGRVGGVQGGPEHLVDEGPVDALAAERVVTRVGDDTELALLDLDDGGVERAAAAVVDEPG